MSQALSLDVKSISDRIKDKVVGEFLNIISDEEWTKMIKERVEEFITKPRQPSGYGNAPTRSEFEIMVDRAMQEKLNEKVKEILNTLPYLNDTDKLEGLIKGMAEKIAEGSLNSFVKSFAQNVVSNMISGGASWRY